MLPPVLLVLAAACALLTSAVALAGPAAAIEDPRRPDVEVTRGPSCGPGVVRVTVTNGTEQHQVALVFDGSDPQATAALGAGEQVELASRDVEWGRTVDVSVTVTGADGTAQDPVELGTYTRPSEADCAAVAPTSSGPGPSSTPAPTGTTTTTATAPSTPPSTSPTPTRRTTTGTSRPSSTAPAPGTPRSTPPASTPSSAADGTTEQAGSASAASVSPGGVVTVRATGFTPGEQVTVSLLGVGDPLTTVTAGRDGSVEAVVQIPRAAALGTATVQLTGGESDATAGLDLQVAARSQPLGQQTTSIPVLATGVALIGAGAVLGLVAARRSRGSAGTVPR